MYDDTTKPGEEPIRSLPNLLAVVPARSGSKRIPGKNVRDFCGKPLLTYTISACLESGLFDDVVVSTDCDRIGEVARTAGASTSRRSPQLSDDQTPSVEVTLAVLRQRREQGMTYDFVAQLLPTSPLRNAADIWASWSFFMADSTSPVVSVTAFAGANPWWTVTVEKDGRMRRRFESAFVQRSQDQQELLAASGAVWWSGCRHLEEARTFYGVSTRGWEVPWPRGIDIDSERDWVLAEALARAGHG